MGNCCKAQSSTPVMEGSHRRTPPFKNHPQRRNQEGSSKETNLREVKIRMTKKELHELVGWLNMADSSFEQVMARLVNVINYQNGDNNNDQVVKLRQQRSWRPSLQSIPEMI